MIIDCEATKVSVDKDRIILAEIVYHLTLAINGADRARDHDIDISKIEDAEAQARVALIEHETALKIFKNDKEQES